ncbi:MAG: fucose-binding lectin protein [Sphingomonadales bacterium]|nr:MAG: fucose-binding lectin protein [Sphingomonadales bacterium]
MADNPDFPVGTAAVNWVDSGGAVHLRVYSCDGYTITERCWDGQSWVNGFTCPGSQVSATAWQDNAGLHLRVYATFQDNTTEWCFDPGSNWQVGQYSKP